MTEVVEEHRASNVNCGELGERLLDVHPVVLHGKMKGCMDQILQVEPPGHSKDMGTTCTHVTDLVGNVLQQVKSIESPAPIWIGSAERQFITWATAFI